MGREGIVHQLCWGFWEATQPVSWPAGSVCRQQGSSEGRLAHCPRFGEEGLTVDSGSGGWDPHPSAVPWTGSEHRASGCWWS